MVIAWRETQKCKTSPLDARGVYNTQHTKQSERCVENERIEATERVGEIIFILLFSNQRCARA